MMSSFDSRNHIMEGTPQKLEECFKNSKQQPTEAELNGLLHICYNKRRSEFCSFLPVLVKYHCA